MAIRDAAMVLLHLAVLMLLCYVLAQVWVGTRSWLDTVVVAVLSVHSIVTLLLREADKARRPTKAKEADPQ